MSVRWLRILVLLIPTCAISSHAQSLGEVARQARAERQQSGVHTKVITNEDIASPATAPAPAKNASPAKDGDGNGQTEASANGSGKSNSGAGSAQAKGVKAPDTPEKQREARELEMQQRTQEINKQYLDRIAALREKINDAQKEMAKLQRDQVESTIEFQRSVGSSPSIVEYQRQQSLFNEQIAAQRSSIVDLNSQLEDAQESARHAGVPHPTD
jgi:hypothetical protein